EHLIEDRLAEPVGVVPQAGLREVEAAHQNFRTQMMCTGRLPGPSWTKLASPQSHCAPVSSSCATNRSLQPSPIAGMFRCTVVALGANGSRLATTMISSPSEPSWAPP